MIFETYICALANNRLEYGFTLDDGARFDSFGPRYLYACITPEGAPSSI
jgi:hypothetical protein